MKYIVISLLFLLISCKQMNTINVETEKFIETFFLAYKSEGVEKSLNDIFASNKYFANNAQSVANVKEQLISIADSLGEYCGYEVVSRNVIGTSLIHYTCIVNYEMRPIRFFFTFYKPQDSWALFQFEFSTDFVDELNQSSKFFYIQ